MAELGTALIAVLRPSDAAARAPGSAEAHLRLVVVGERAEAGVDAVDWRVALDRGGDHGPARLHGGEAVAEFGGRLARRGVHHVLDRERAAGDGHNSHRG